MVCAKKNICILSIIIGDRFFAHTHTKETYLVYVCTVPYTPGFIIYTHTHTLNQSPHIDAGCIFSFTNDDLCAAGVRLSFCFKCCVCVCVFVCGCRALNQRVPDPIHLIWADRIQTKTGRRRACVCKCVGRLNELILVRPYDPLIKQKPMMINGLWLFDEY